MILVTYDELENDYRKRKATLPVDEINHREFVRNGVRYFCCWSSEKGDVGWHVYKTRKETSHD